MAKKKTSQQPAPVKDKPQAPAQDLARTAAPARVTTVSLTTCLVTAVRPPLPGPRRPLRPSSPRSSRRPPNSRPRPAFPPN